MKFIILACVLGFAAADLLKAAAPAVDRTVLDFLEGASQSGSLSEALGIDEPWVRRAEDDIKTELGKQLRESLNQMLEKIKEHLEHGKGVANDLADKVKEIRAKLKEMQEDVGNKAKELIEKIKNKTKDFLKELLERGSLGKRSMDHQMDSVARSSAFDFFQFLRDRILREENMVRIRDYINGMEDNPTVRKLKEFVATLSNSELQEIVRGLLEHRISSSDVAHSETWDKVKEFFKDLHVKIQDHSKKFGEWLKNTWSKGTDKLKERYGTIKAIALEFISHAKDTSAEVAREALEFFRPYKEDLGTLWQQIVDASKEAIGQF